MKNTTLLFPGFHLQTLRKKPRSAQQVLAQKLAQIKNKSLTQLSECFSEFIPDKYLRPSSTGPLSRRRLFSKDNIFWGFLAQVLDADGGCQEVVRKFQAVAALKSMKAPSSSTAAYCKARKKLDESELEVILNYTALLTHQPPSITPLTDRRVIVVDGTGVSMPDTEENQSEWPQPSGQAEGCGFPLATICACFNLQSGALLSYKLGSKKSSELPLLRQQWNTFKKDDIFLGDKGFCSYFDVSSFKDRGVDSVITLARRLPATETTSLKALGENDLLIKWDKPKFSKNLSYSLEDWKNLPEKLVLRQIKVVVQQAGFRVKEFYIVTTLLDAKKYSAKQIADLYFQRWDVELFFRDIKTTMGMDILCCNTPSLVRKEILMYFIAYNCIRRLMIDAIKRKGTSHCRVSFKGSIQAVRQWESHLHQININKEQREQLLVALYSAITSYIVPDRPGRREPRCRKRRPKTFQLLTKPRHKMVEIPHRSRYRAKQA